MKKKYEKPIYSIHAVYQEDSVLNSSTPINLGGPNGTDFKYNPLVEQEIVVDDWQFTDQNL